MDCEECDMKGRGPIEGNAQEIKKDNQRSQYAGSDSNPASFEYKKETRLLQQTC
jgi:hypothetical protein